ncbi:MAG: hypothetical protein AB7W37_05650 [Syntrophobacteraceae bacterium]|jgi:hypothetical protein
MDGKQNGTSKWVEIAVKVALSLAATFPLYFLFYITYPASIFALYIITAGLFLAFAPWDDLKKKFLS